MVSFLFLFSPDKMKTIVSERVDDENTSDFKCGEPYDVKINLEDFMHATQ